MGDLVKKMAEVWSEDWEPSTPAPGEVETDMDKLRRFVALTDRKKALDARVTEIKEQLADLEPHILEYMQENGIQSANVDGYTVYLRRDVRASFRRTDEAFAAVKDNGLEDALVTTINAQRAAAIVREILKDSVDGPPDWVDVAFSYTDDFRAGIRKAR